LWIGFQNKISLGIVAMVEYFRMIEISPTQCYVTASFNFGNDDVSSNKIHLSQLKLFVEKERRKDPPNASITTHAGAVVDVNFAASYEVQTFDNGNDNVIEIESDESLHIACLATTAINLPYARSTTTTTYQHYNQQLQQLKPSNFHHVTALDDAFSDTRQ
jgi:hypothetical protein